MVDLLPLPPEERARQGIFLAFQYPIELPGVVNAEFLRAAFNAVVSAQGGEELDAFDFAELLQDKLRLLQMDEKFLERQVNVNFSGGEKKRNEILQMAVLNPRLAFLDETDSGLDVDSLKQVAFGVQQLKSSENSLVLVTHYERLLTYIVPDVVHIFHAGRIVCSGDKSLAAEVEKYGFDPFITAATVKG
jgi:Fe-S cluster assembly ATP-binding protein